MSTIVSTLDMPLLCIMCLLYIQGVSTLLLSSIHPQRLYGHSELVSK